MLDHTQLVALVQSQRDLYADALDKLARLLTAHGADARAAGQRSYADQFESVAAAARGLALTYGLEPAKPKPEKPAVSLYPLDLPAMADAVVALLRKEPARVLTFAEVTEAVYGIAPPNLSLVRRALEYGRQL